MNKTEIMLPHKPTFNSIRIATPRYTRYPLFNIGEFYTKLGNKHIFIGPEPTLFGLDSPLKSCTEYINYNCINFLDEGYIAKDLISIDNQKYHLVVTSYNDIVKYTWLMKCIVKSGISGRIIFHIPDYACENMPLAQLYVNIDYLSEHPNLKIHVFVDHKKSWYVKSNGIILHVIYNEDGTIATKIEYE